MPWLLSRPPPETPGRPVRKSLKALKLLKMNLPAENAAGNDRF
jgi:hypothetical protein